MKPIKNILGKIQIAFPYFYTIIICLIYLADVFPLPSTDKLLSIIFVACIVLMLITQFYFQFKYVNQIFGTIILFCSIMVALAVYSDIVNMTTTWTWTIKRILIISFVMTNFYAAISLLMNNEQSKLQWQQWKSIWKVIRKRLLLLARVAPRL